MHPLIIESCKNLVTFINENENTLDLTDLCPRYTSNNIASCVFGIEDNSFKQSRSNLMKMGDKIANCAFASVKQTIAMFLPTPRKLLRVT